MTTRRSARRSALNKPCFPYLPANAVFCLPSEWPRSFRPRWFWRCFFFCSIFCLPLLHADVLGQLLDWSWKPFQGHFGILAMIAASFVLACSAMLLAFPLGAGICCFAHGMGPPRLARLVLRTIQLMTSVPTVVYGFVAVFVLVPLLRGVFHHGSGFSWLAALLGLAVLCAAHGGADAAQPVSGG